jgi:hypothetical protein
MSQQSNYKLKYHNFIDKRRQRPLTKEKGYEIHHIIPKSIGGSNKKSNLVKLTYREHFIAHRMLSKYYKGWRAGKMIVIVAKMSRSSFYSDCLKSFDYEKIRDHHSQAVKKWWTPKRRAEQRQRKLGKKVPKLSQSINNLWEQGVYDNRKSSTDAQKKRWQKDRNKLVKKFKETRNDPAYRQSQSQRMKLWWQEQKSLA